MHAMPRAYKQIDSLTMTEPALSYASTLRRWFWAASHWLASSPLALRPVRQRVDLANLQEVSDVFTTSAAASSPAWGCAAESDPRRESTTADIAAEDWDLLFRAALALLERVAVERPAPSCAPVKLQAPDTALQECLVALNQLRRSVPPYSPSQLPPGSSAED